MVLLLVHGCRWTLPWREQRRINKAKPSRNLLPHSCHERAEMTPIWGEQTEPGGKNNNLESHSKRPKTACFLGYRKLRFSGSNPAAPTNKIGQLGQSRLVDFLLSFRDPQPPARPPAFFFAFALILLLVSSNSLARASEITLGGSASSLEFGCAANRRHPRPRRRAQGPGGGLGHRRPEAAGQAARQGKVAGAGTRAWSRGPRVRLLRDSNLARAAGEAVPHRLPDCREGRAGVGDLRWPPRSGRRVAGAAAAEPRGVTRADLPAQLGYVSPAEFERRFERETADLAAQTRCPLIRCSSSRARRAGDLVVGDLSGRPTHRRLPRHSLVPRRRSACDKLSRYRRNA